MKPKQLSQILLLTSSVWLFCAMSVTAQEIAKSQIQSKSIASLLRKSRIIREITQLNQIELPNTSARMLVQSPAPNVPPYQEKIEGGVIQVTGVQAKPTQKGVEVILQTTGGDKLQITNRSAENNFIADIPNAQLRLPNGDAFTFRSQKPAEGITVITVTNLDANTIRVTVAGESGLPTVELFDSDEGLIFGLTPAATAMQPPQQPEGEQPTSETPQEKPSVQEDEPIELVVTGEQDGYRVPNASTATKTDTPLRDIPQSIQVVPQQVIRDQQATRIEDALKNVPGVTQRSGLYSSATNFTIRGFDASDSGNVLRDGLFDSAGGVTGQGFGTDLFNIDRVEVLKGPASVLYGSAAPGGTVNLVTKKPLRDPFYQVEATIGNYDFYSGRVDLSGPLNDSKSVLYRLNVGYENSGSFINFFDRQSLSISPSLSFRLGDRTNLTLQGEYASIDAGSYVGLPTVGTVFPNPNGKIPRSFNSGEPSDFVRTENSRVGYRLEHQFSDNWSLRNAFQVKFSTLDVDAVVARSLDSDNRTLNRIRVTNEGDGETYILTTDLIGNFSTGSIKHQLLVGFDWNSDNTTYTRRSRGTGVPSLDIFDPIYNQPQAEEPFEIDFSSNYGSDSLGIYIQDIVSLTSNLKLLLGLRYDTQDYNFRDLTSDFRYSQADSAFSPRVGIVYQPIPPISLYASYARSFTPSLFGNSVDGRPFKPGRGTQYEVGVKADLSNRLSATLAFYDLTRTNVSTDDPNNLGFSIQTGEQRSRGIEFNIGGEILPGLNVIAGYSYIDAQITKDNVFPVGNRLNDVPYNSFNLWTTYQIQQGSLQGLGFGLGLFYVGERQGDLDNTPTYVLPSYFRTDAAIFYQRGRYRAALNFTNLFNVNYFEGIGDFELIAGAPFTVRGTISWEF
ncbi:TonB-dependent siderophore receptor [Nostoc sp. 'Lobaria pulmonaria (5183) cyanobiont']|uniref:TonB-dependent siderophore receptor n=1 Tax=Nostoc sp. 'Lobaria pulmonaria (5183) cyanobiont' TaxID=1618022 RepID=UPI000CF3259B|nr:TonB-dependent siderophore receptor [Nostoc sp. 'Lobaria pulmonaria (5183) cyanobiont']AVH69211.1 TonB-dependent siderophore receptor [Nostoc sp. 'Lobaria pulmonaria (5183) cyanobiont']